MKLVHFSWIFYQIVEINLFELKDQLIVDNIDEIELLI